MANPQTVPTKILIVIALLQGIALGALHYAIETDTWPAVSRPALYACFAIALIGPEILLLTLVRQRMSQLIAGAALFTAVAALLAYYVGSQSTATYRDSSVALLILTLGIATFLATLYIQQLTTARFTDYKTLFSNSWTNLLTLTLALLFTLCVWGVLSLWAALFNSIDISFFDSLFEQRWFLYTVLPLAHGLGIAMLRQHAHLFERLVLILRLLIKGLLVILALVAVLFLLTLSFTGLKPLWESGGSLLILWLLVIMLFAINAVYQDSGSDRGTAPSTYPRGLHGFVTAAILILPVYCVISFYGISQRVSQYGWTVDRCWSAAILALLGTCSLSYAANIVRRRDNWPAGLAGANTVLGIAVLALMLAVNSPFLDFRKISAESQVERLENGQVSREEFDFCYLGYNLGKAGEDALAQLQSEQESSLPLCGEQHSFSREEIMATVSLPQPAPPTEVLNAVYHKLKDMLQLFPVGSGASRQLFDIDLDEDGQTEYLLLLRQAGSSYIYAALYFKNDGQWQSRQVNEDYYYGLKSRESAALPNQIKREDLIIEAPRWQNIRVGDAVLKVQDY